MNGHSVILKRRSWSWVARFDEKRRLEAGATTSAPPVDVTGQIDDSAVYALQMSELIREIDERQ
jgi:hypothetical protein